MTSLSKQKLPPRKRAHAAVRAKTGKTARQQRVQKRIDLAARSKAREQMLIEREELIADIRDQCVGEAFTSGLSDSQIHQRGGPTPGTIKKWRNKETRLPQLATARMLLRAVGKDIAIVDYVVGARK